MSRRCATIAAAVSRHDLRLPARRHRDPDSELRLAGADRRAGHRLEARRQPGLCGQAARSGSRGCRASPTRACSRPSTLRPSMSTSIDARAQIVGVTERDVAQNMLDALAGSIQTAPTFWLNPKNGVSYPIVAQTPQYRIDTMSNSGKHSRIAKGRPTSRFWAAWRPSSAASATPWCPTTPFSRSSIFTPPTRPRSRRGRGRHPEDPG